jgi:hypothetical protein
MAKSNVFIKGHFTWPSFENGYSAHPDPWHWLLHDQRRFPAEERHYYPEIPAPYKAADTGFGTGYAERTKNISKYFKAEFKS